MAADPVLGSAADKPFGVCSQAQRRKPAMSASSLSGRHPRGGARASGRRCWPQAPAENRHGWGRCPSPLFRDKTGRTGGGPALCLFFFYVKSHQNHRGGFYKLP